MMIFVVLGVLLGGLAVSGCGDSSEDPSPAPDYAKKLAGAPAPLAAAAEAAAPADPDARAQA